MKKNKIKDTDLEKQLQELPPLSKRKMKSVDTNDTDNQYIPTAQKNHTIVVDTEAKHLAVSLPPLTELAPTPLEVK